MLKAFLRREASQSDRVDQLLQAERNTPRQQRVLFLYWGRRGLSEFALMLAEAARARSDFHAVFSVSRQNDRFDEFQRLGECVEPIDTFESNIGALFAVWRVRRARNQILARIHRDRINTVVSLMPHVWTPLVAPSIRAAGVKFVSLIHDAMPHPGDVKSLVASWAFRDLQNSDLILTLSEHVTRSLKNGDKVDPSIVRTLFHPHLRFSEPTRPAWPSAGQPFRVLFLGRVLPYKGLDLLIESVEGLRATGLAIQLGVFGEGALGANADRLKAIGAEVENRWLSANEMSAIVARYHVIALSHKEASQSGIAALAAGHCVPVVANPVGGLVEQIIDGRTGIIASAANSMALGEAIASLARDCQLYNTITSALREDCDQNSIELICLKF